MPTYEYECAKCGEHVEAYQTFSEEPLKKHNQCEGSKCTGALHKVFSPVGIVLKGSGFYKNDSRDSSRSRSKASSEKSSSDSKSDSKSDTKTETKSDSKSDTKKSDSSSGTSDTKKTPAKTAKKSA
jgi:putative FmdB family regulatory protein